MKEKKPTRMYLQAIHDLLASGKIRLHRIDHSFAPLYVIVGYYDDEYLYLLASVVFRAVQQHYRDQGATFPIVWSSLRKRLVEERIITTDANGSPTMVKYIPSKKGQDRLLHVKRSALRQLGLDPSTSLEK